MLMTPSPVCGGSVNVTACQLAGSLLLRSKQNVRASPCGDTRMRSFPRDMMYISCLWSHSACSYRSLAAVYTPLSASEGKTLSAPCLMFFLRCGDEQMKDKRVEYNVGEQDEYGSRV